MQRIQDQVILVTGATDGLGRQVAHDLAVRGATLFLHGRHPDKGADTLRTIQAAAGNNRLGYYNADFSSLEEVRQLARQIRDTQDRLDILINNAGMGKLGGGSRAESAEGYEIQFAVNYLAPFLLTHSLLPLLQRSSPSRIINVASVGQHPIDFDDVMLEKGEYDGFRAYRQSKLAQVMFTFDLAKQLDSHGVAVNAVHPATLMATNMVHSAFGREGATSTIGQGADAVEHLATSPELDGVTGLYFDGRKKARANAQAYDENARRRLRALSEDLTGFSPSGV